MSDALSWIWWSKDTFLVSLEARVYNILVGDVVIISSVTKYFSVYHEYGRIVLLSSFKVRCGNRTCFYKQIMSRNNMWYYLAETFLAYSKVVIKSSAKLKLLTAETLSDYNELCLFSNLQSMHSLNKTFFSCLVIFFFFWLPQHNLVCPDYNREGFKNSSPYNTKNEQ